MSNPTAAPIRVQMLSTLVQPDIQPDIVEYLDSGKIGAREADGERLLMTRAVAGLLGRRGLGPSGRRSVR